MFPPHVLCLYLMCQRKTPDGKQNREKRGGNKGDSVLATFINKARGKTNKEIGEVLLTVPGTAAWSLGEGVRGR